MRAFITVIGRDTVGVIARISTVCSELNIMQEMFCMIMLVDLSKCTVSHEELRSRFAQAGAELGMQVNVTRQEVFDAMHKI